MSGMEMLFKQMLGVDPVQIRAQLEEYREKLPQMIESADIRITEMESKLTNIDNNIKVLYRLLVESEVIKPVANDPAALPHEKVNGHAGH
jgi:septation ring formation regulator EzrA